jgi:WD40 repeat protein
MAWSPNSRYVLVGAYDFTATIFDIKMQRAEQRFASHWSGVSSVAWSGDGHLIATAGWDGKAEVRYPRSGRVVGSLHLVGEASDERDRD